MMNFINKNIFIKRNIYFFIFAFIIIVILFYFFTKVKTGIDSEDIGIGTGSLTGGINSGNYYSESKIINTSTEIENLDQKLKQEGKIEGANLSFDRYGFIDSSENIDFKLHSNIKLEIDAGNTGLIEGTNLKISIPGADFESLITIPGRYRYSLYFTKGGEQEISIIGSGLSNGKITKYINLN